MSFLEILNSILIMPLQLLFEVIYMIANKIIGNPGTSIIVLSLLMNFLVLPLYKRADAMQEEERDIEMRLRDGVAHIKKTFKGDERMMMLQTYYRQNNYKPTYVLRGAVSLFLEIPFFIAAYHFLSELQLLNGVSYGPIADLSKPDGMLVLGGVTINILPIIMTSINLVSCVIFTKGSSAKQKIQLYGMAIFFLVFLYTSPSGLVFYWTLNNLFSLVKTIFYKINNPAKILSVMFSCTGMCILVYGLCFYSMPTVKRTIFFIMCFVAMQIPLVFMVSKNHLKNKVTVHLGESNRAVFWSGGCFLAVFTGVLIPSAVIKSSPQEFVDINYFYHPVWFIASAFCLAVGIFIVWAGVFYWLAKPSIKVLFDYGIWTISGIALVNYMFFGKNLGILNSELKYDNGLDFKFSEQMWNALIVLIIAVVLIFVAVKKQKQRLSFLIILTIAIGGMGIGNIVSINKYIGNITEQDTMNGEIPKFKLSKSGKNVVVLMLDRAQSLYIPYIFNEKPELEEKFAGFTYYPNTISFGGYTNMGLPALLGGYEYTPMEINKRDQESLASKQNEALKVMPVLFDENGFNVTVCDPTYANYQWIPDLSIYSDYPDIKSYITKGKFSNMESKKIKVKNNKRQFFCYSILKSSPLCIQELLYDQGNYNQSNNELNGNVEIYAGQTMQNRSVADGIYGGFMDSYNVLKNMSEITEIDKSEENTFLFMANDTTHDPMLLQEPDYIPKDHVDNTKYDNENEDRFTVNNVTITMDLDVQMKHYHANMATMLCLGEWFDYLRENDVFDNTKIILVADHGQHLNQMPQYMLEDGNDSNILRPLLMVKDFNSKEFKTSDTFMTNADVPTIATKDLIKNPVNPFTGNSINSDKKENEDQVVLLSYDYDVRINNGNTFLPGSWYSVKDDSRNINNWTLLEKNDVLKSR